MKAASALLLLGMLAAASAAEEHTPHYGRIGAPHSAARDIKTSRKLLGTHAAKDLELSIRAPFFNGDLKAPIPGLTGKAFIDANSLLSALGISAGPALPEPPGAAPRAPAAAAAAAAAPGEAAEPFVDVKITPLDVQAAREQREALVKQVEAQRAAWAKQAAAARDQAARDVAESVKAIADTVQRPLTTGKPLVDLTITPLDADRLKQQAEELANEVASAARDIGREFAQLAGVQPRLFAWDSEAETDLISAAPEKPDSEDEAVAEEDMVRPLELKPFIVRTISRDFAAEEELEEAAKPAEANPAPAAVAKEAPAKPEPAAKAPAKPEPAAKAAPAKPEPAAKEALAKPEPAAKAAPAKPEPAAKEAPAKPEPAAKEAPAKPEPAAKEAPAKPEPAAKEAPAKPEPAGKEAPAKPEPAGKEAPAKPEPATKEAPAKPEPAAKEAPAKPEPVEIESLELESGEAEDASEADDASLAAAELEAEAEDDASSTPIFQARGSFYVPQELIDLFAPSQTGLQEETEVEAEGEGQQQLFTQDSGPDSWMWWGRQPDPWRGGGRWGGAPNPWRGGRDWRNNGGGSWRDPWWSASN